jgi:hypothetical protein
LKPRQERAKASRLILALEITLDRGRQLDDAAPPALHRSDDAIDLGLPVLAGVDLRRRDRSRRARRGSSSAFFRSALSRCSRAISFSSAVRSSAASVQVQPLGLGRQVATPPERRSRRRYPSSIL